MDSKRPSLSVKSANAYKLPGSRSGSGSASGSGLSGNNTTKLVWNNISLVKVVPVSGELRYLTQLWVSEKEETWKELHQSKTIGFKGGAGSPHVHPLGKVLAHSGADCVNPHDQNMQNKITAALKLLTFRKEHVLVQFWSAGDGGEHQSLTTKDQPFGLGVIDEGIYSYRKDNVNSFVFDMDHKEEEDENVSPPVRVFKRGLPEWTPDLTSYLPKDFPQQELAIRSNLHGYLALPVFDSTTGLCLGVIEVLLMYSKCTSFAFEVQQIHEALKAQNLTCAQAFDVPALNSANQVPNEHRQIELLSILGILKSVCDIHNLPLAWTWAVSPYTSLVSHDKTIKNCCNSFGTKCIGKVCMSTAGLPCHVQDLLKWKFKGECRAWHLEKSKGIVGRALLSCGLSYCEDVTKLNEEEYPLVHYACIYKLTGCFAIFLRSLEGNAEYVLEFFLPLGKEDIIFVQDVVETLKQKIEVDSVFEFGDTSPTYLPNISDCESIVTDVLDTGSSINASMKKRHPTFIDDGETSNPLKKLKIDSYPGRSLTVKVTFEEHMTSFQFHTSLGLLGMETEVAQRFKLQGKRLSLKYKDEDGDMISIPCDASLTDYLVTSGSNSFNLICGVTD